MTLARRQLKLALDQQASAQKQVDMALENLRTARVTGDEEKVKEAKEEVKEAEEKAEKAEEEANEESLPLLEKFAGELDDLDELILNSRINNKEDMPFLERDEVIQSIVEEMKKTQRLKINKPRIVCLWSPRGTGKTSVIRRLAKMDEYAESRRCGRLLIFDAAWIPTQMSVEAAASTLVSAMVLWHLLQLLDGYGVKLAGQVVNFNYMDFKDVVEVVVVEVVERLSKPVTGLGQPSTLNSNGRSLRRSTGLCLLGVVGSD